MRARYHKEVRWLQREQDNITRACMAGAFYALSNKQLWQEI